MNRKRGLPGLVLLAFSLLALPAAGSARQTGLQFREVAVGSAVYRFEVYVPSKWNENSKWPVILFLHGVGHRGEYPPNPNKFAIGQLFQSYQNQDEAIVVFPRCRTNGFWNNPEMEQMALKALEQTIKDFNGDPERVYLTGLSMGGYGTWFLASRYPGKFAAIAPVCGGIRTPETVPIPALSTASDPYTEVARKIGKTPVWVFHGSADEVIRVEESRKMVRALRAIGGNVRYTEYKGVKHNAWDRAYSEPGFFRWLFSHRLHSAASRSR